MENIKQVNPLPAKFGFSNDDIEQISHIITAWKRLRYREDAKRNDYIVKMAELIRKSSVSKRDLNALLNFQEKAPSGSIIGEIIETRIFCLFYFIKLDKPECAVTIHKLWMRNWNSESLKLLFENILFGLYRRFGNALNYKGSM